MIRKYPRKYLWVSKEFSDWLVRESHRLRAKGNYTTTDDLTHKLINEVKIQDKVVFDKLFIRGVWKDKKRKNV